MRESVFASLVPPRTIPVPGDPEHTVTIRKLAPKHIRGAREAVQARSYDDLRKMGGATFLRELGALFADEERRAGESPGVEASPAAASGEPPAIDGVPAAGAAAGDASVLARAAAEAWSDPVRLFDPVELLVAGVRSWTFKDGAGKPVPVTRELIEELDEEIQTALAREVLRFAKPGLFQSAEESKADQKND